VKKSSSTVTSVDYLSNLSNDWEAGLHGLVNTQLWRKADFIHLMQGRGKGISNLAVAPRISPWSVDSKRLRFEFYNLSRWFSRLSLSSAPELVDNEDNEAHSSFSWSSTNPCTPCTLKTGKRLRLHWPSNFLRASSHTAMAIHSSWQNIILKVFTSLWSVDFFMLYATLLDLCFDNHHKEYTFSLKVSWVLNHLSVSTQLCMHSFLSEQIFQRVLYSMLISLSSRFLSLYW